MSPEIARSPEVRADRRRRGPRRWAARATAVASGLVASALLLEASLWTLHPFLRPAAREQQAAELLAGLAPAPGERRIACFGDSNTYGIHLEAEASYPGRLQRLLDRAAGNPWRVINIGYPGQNTAQIRGRLAANLDAYRPEIVIVWAGVNNTWSTAMGHLWEQEDEETPAGFLETLLQHSRLLKSLRMHASRDTRMGFDDPETPGGVPGIGGVQRGEGLGEVEGAFGPRKTTAPDKETARTIRMDLRRMQTLCEERGAALVVVDYPLPLAGVGRAINPAIRRFARANGVPLVALHERALPQLEAIASPRAFFDDWHATSLGNVAIAGEVLATLVEAGLLERRAEWTDLPNALEMSQRCVFEVASASPRSLRCELFAPPRSTYCVRAKPLWARQGGAEDPADLREGRMEAARLEGRVSPQGYAFLELPLPEDTAELERSAPPDRTLWGWRLHTGFGTPVSGDEPGPELEDASELTSVDVPLLRPSGDRGESL